MPPGVGVQGSSALHASPEIVFMNALSMLVPRSRTGGAVVQPIETDECMFLLCMKSASTKTSVLL